MVPIANRKMPQRRPMAGKAAKPRVQSIGLYPFAAQIQDGLVRVRDYVQERSAADGSYYRWIGKKEDACLRKLERAMLGNRQVSAQAARKMYADLRLIMQSHGLIKKIGFAKQRGLKGGRPT